MNYLLQKPRINWKLKAGICFAVVIILGVGLYLDSEAKSFASAQSKYEAAYSNYDNEYVLLKMGIMESNAALLLRTDQVKNKDTLKSLKITNDAARPYADKIVKLKNASKQEYLDQTKKLSTLRDELVLYVCILSRETKAVYASRIYEKKNGSGTYKPYWDGRNDFAGEDNEGYDDDEDGFNEDDLDDNLNNDWDAYEDKADANR
ncbi:MAG: hypothetical protein LBB10_02285 [Bifidobacteriaceae bacterium]|jgi:hypothetical protein|nr:hypothetical protein [Bifidobacteriaceae bacterium]